MDLQGLLQAYQAAPSTELARVIAIAISEQEDRDSLAQYAIAAKTVLSESEKSSLAQQLLASADMESARQLLEADQQDSDMTFVTEATPETVTAIAATQDESQLEQSQADDLSEQRPKLKVIENTDFSEVTDMARYRQDTTNFNDVVGLEAIKKQITKKIIMPFQRPSLFQRFKKKVGGGVLLYGPPGCGKTLLARATAGECNAQFFNIEISDVLDMYIGESEQKLHAIFEKARQQTPSVVFFDEIEALAGKREHSRNAASANVVSQFLTELDGFSQKNEGVLVLASTNVPWAIDPAFLRPGRFDRMFFVPPPDKTARQSILTHHMKGRPGEGNINFSTIAAKTSGYSGADLYNLLDMAADEAIDDSLANNQEVDISQEHIVEAVKQSRSTTTEWLTTARNYARYANDGGRYDDVLEFLKKHGK